MTEINSSRQYFDHISNQWESKYGPNGSMQSRALAFIEKMPRPDGTCYRLLDFGCGSGDLSCRYVDVGFEVVGVDESTDMIRRARERFGERAQFVPIDPTDSGRLPFADASFDVLVASSSLEYVAELDDYLFEVARVLREGGAFVVTVPGTQTLLRRWEKIEAAIWRNWPFPVWSGILARVNYLRFSINRFQIPEWQMRLETAGLLVDSVAGRGDNLVFLSGKRIAQVNDASR